MTVDDALQTALDEADGVELDSKIYDKLMNGLKDDVEKDAFTMGLATKGIQVMSMTLDQFKKHFKQIAEKQGCVYEDDYHAACYDITDIQLLGKINTWLVSSGLPLKKNKPEGENQYRKKVKDIAKHPDIKKLQQKRASKENPIVKESKDPEDKCEYFPTWKKKKAQRIDEEKRMLEDTIRAREYEIPNARELLQKVERAEDFRELREIWDEVHNPAFASKGARVVVPKSMEKVSFKDIAFHVTVAKTAHQKAAGLEVIDKLGSKDGMLFPFENEHVTFHMGSVKFPIDIVFLMDDPSGLKVAKIVHNAQPGAVERWSYGPTAYVLEVAGGSCKKHSIKLNSICKISKRVSLK